MSESGEEFDAVYWPSTKKRTRTAKPRRDALVSTTRPLVDAFADTMEAKLAESRHNGDREGWRSLTLHQLLALLLTEVGELARTIPHEGALSSLAKEQVLSECAYVANLAMMIADVAGGLALAREAAK